MSVSKAHIKASAKYDAKTYKTVTLKLKKPVAAQFEKYCNDKNKSKMSVLTDLVIKELKENGYEILS